MPLFFAPVGTVVLFVSHINWEDLFFNNLNHIIDMYYICGESETINHNNLGYKEQFSDADVAPKVDMIVEKVRQAMVQYETYSRLFQI